MDAARFAFACAALIVICNADRSFRLDDSLTIKQIIRSFTNNDESSVHTLQTMSGHAENCGPSGTKLNLTWTPKTITLGQDLAINFSFLPVTSLTKANIKALVYNGNGTAKSLSLEWTFTYNCDEIRPYFKCPIQKGAPLHTHRMLKKLDYELPNGLFTVKFNITNEKQELFLCAVVIAKIQPP